MMAPFEYFANRFQERIKDELSDIQAAGGLLAVAKRQQEPFVKDFAESMRFTQQMNKRFAEIAAALPGSTQEYVEVGKRLGDTAGRIVANDVGKAIAEANILRQARGEQAIVGEGRKQQQAAIQELLGELTTKTVLAGLGGGGGGGRNLGPYGLPGLTERLIGQDQVSMGQFQRYSAIFKDPAIMQALDRFIPQINAAQKDSIERFKILKKMYDEILPPEVIRAFERSFSGLMEIYNTAIFNPEKGILGLGRKMQGLGPAMDDMGRYIKVLEDGTVKVVNSIKEADKADLSVFDLFRDVMANIGLTLAPIVNNLTLLFDPMKKIGNLLVQARIESGRFLFAFESYRKGLADMVKQMSPERQKVFTQIPIELRASLAAINNLFRKFGVIDVKEFEANAKQIMSDKFDVAAMMKEFFDTFLDSKIAKNVGKTVGMIVGTVLSEVANLMKQFMGVTKASGLVEGLKEGFNKAGGVQAIKDIISMVFQGMFNLILTVIKTAPFESAMVAGLFMLPSVIAGVISSAVTAAFTGGLPLLKVGFQKLIANLLKVKPVSVKEVAKPITDPRRMLPAAKAATGALPGTNIKAAEKAVTGFGAKLGFLGKIFTKIGKIVPVVSTAFAALDFILGKMSGESLGEAAGGALGGLGGGIIGAILGSALGPVGTAVGGVLGTWLGDWLGSEIGKAIQYLSENLSSVSSKLTTAWQGIETWFQQLPYNLGVAVGRFTVAAGDALVNFYNWFSNLSTQFGEWVNKTVVSLRLKWNNFINQVSADFQSGAIWSKLGNALITGLKKVLDFAINWLNNFNPATIAQRGIEFGKQFFGEFTQGFRAGQVQQRSATPAPTAAPGTGISPIFSRANGSLGDAIRSEMRMKPPGSDLVIANSSETVIPAAGGYGMLDFVETLRSGFGLMVRTYRETQDKQSNMLKGIKDTLVSNQMQTNARLQKLETKFSTPGMTGGLGGAAAGGVDAFTPIAQKYGLQMTSGYRPGDPGWHGANRARDFSNGTGPTPQMMQFAQYLASTYGSNLKELIYTPLGFSIKNGQRVPPYAQGSHYNHVHVAYALGGGNPAFFANKKDAISWENKFLGKGVKSITTNTAELAQAGDGMMGPGWLPWNWGKLVDQERKTNKLNSTNRAIEEMVERGYISPSSLRGGNQTSSLPSSPINITAPITINQQPGQDADELASIVALKIGEAVSDARAASLFV
jgi:hypothetical protein